VAWTSKEVLFLRRIEPSTSGLIWKECTVAVELHESLSFRRSNHRPSKPPVVLPRPAKVDRLPSARRPVPLQFWQYWCQKDVTKAMCKNNDVSPSSYWCLVRREFSGMIPLNHYESSQQPPASHPATLRFFHATIPQRSCVIMRRRKGFLVAVWIKWPLAM